MKCPKCGSALDTGFNCPNCGYKRYEVAVSKTELTTAEMLLWLVENAQEIVEIDKFRDSYTISVDRAGYESCQVVSRKTLTEAISKAYEWAKQEEQNA